MVILLGVAFTVVERRHGDPMFELGLLANRGFSTFALAAGSIVIVLIPLLVYLPSYLISVVGLDASAAGIWLLMLTVPTVLLPTTGAALARRLSTTMVAAISVAVTGVGVLSLVTIGAQSTPLGLLVPLVLSGSGFGLSTGLLDGQAISSVAPEQSGTAAGMFNTARLASETVAIAIVAAILAALTGNRLSGTGYTSALHAVCIALAAFAVLATAAVTLLARRGTT